MPSRPARKRISSKLTNDEVARLLGLPTDEEFSDAMERHDVGSDAYEAVRRQAIREGEDEGEAEKLAMAAQQREQDKAYREHENALQKAADDAFEEHGLVLIWGKKGTVEVGPSTSWEDAARKILHTLNGVGESDFSNLKEFLSSGPYTAREAVLSHLGAIKDRSRVYGTPSPRRMYDQAIR